MEHVNGDLNMAGYSASNVCFQGMHYNWEDLLVEGQELNMEWFGTHDVRFPDPSFDIGDNYAVHSTVVFIGQRASAIAAGGRGLVEHHRSRDAGCECGR